ncbi:thiol reductant ABC exporter subunit CydC [Paenibacillus sp. LMG 31456]|uniref:Thiol reductant ABC exporter subunit CydC n=1 Tax=Paenibacillus foliorum TaxID=2654974 RepID=A0A972JZY8_9BACL|nr:thiol reductant ABC exporter subunit CydC [Paenibacillus foliorum]NOU93280.1 thiol reductant ABC exporter subunit CydC [Paenibacillus foliorum]
MKERWVLHYLRSYCGSFLFIIGLSVLTLAASAALTFTSGYLISKAALRPENILMVYVPVVAVRTFGISKAVLNYVERLAGHNAVLRILSLMRVKLYRRLEPHALNFFAKFRTGDLLGVLAEDIEQLQHLYLRTIFPSAAALILYGAIITALGAMDISFALLMTMYIGLLLFILPGISLLITRQRLKKIQHYRGLLYQKLTDAILGMADWTGSGRQKDFVKSYEADEQIIEKAEQDIRRWERWRAFIGQCIAGLTLLSVLLWAYSQVKDHSVPVTWLAALVLVVFPVMDIFMSVVSAADKLPQYKGSLNRLQAIDGLLPPASDSENNDTALPQQNRPQINRENIHIQLNHVFFRYDQTDSWIVKDLSLDIPQGKKIAVIGRSGAGKSTLLKLLFGALTPSKGIVTVNGQEIDSSHQLLGKHIAVLNQNPYLFDTTVANNIRLSNQAADEQELQQAIAQAKLTHLLQELPLGERTMMHEAGRRFSGGERQRVALARILLQKCPVVLLDEPTLGLDPVTEKKLLSTVFQALEGKSLIWVTHHLVGIERMDEIIFIEEGEIVMRGTHQQLYEQSSRYRKLYALDKPSLLEPSYPLL